MNHAICTTCIVQAVRIVLFVSFVHCFVWWGHMVRSTRGFFLEKWVDGRKRGLCWQCASCAWDGIGIVFFRIMPFCGGSWASPSAKLEQLGTTEIDLGLRFGTWLITTLLCFVTIISPYFVSRDIMSVFFSRQGGGKNRRGKSQWFCPLLHTRSPPLTTMVVFLQQALPLSVADDVIFFCKHGGVLEQMRERISRTNWLTCAAKLSEDLF